MPGQELPQRTAIGAAGAFAWKAIEDGLDERLPGETGASAEAALPFPAVSRRSVWAGAAAGGFFRVLLGPPGFAQIEDPFLLAAEAGPRTPAAVVAGFAEPTAVEIPRSAGAAQRELDLEVGGHIGAAEAVQGFIGDKWHYHNQ